MNLAVGFHPPLSLRSHMRDRLIMSYLLQGRERQISRDAQGESLSLQGFPSQSSLYRAPPMPAVALEVPAGQGQNHPQ